VSEFPAERVLVVPAKLFRSLGYFQGFNSQVDRYLTDLFSPQHVSYLPRSRAEHDPGFKQLIPYVIFCYTDTDKNLNLFQYTRGSGMGEGRLHSKRSVGIGGHISAIDADPSLNSSPYEEGMRRELDEEVEITTPYTAKCVGLINDDQTEVGSVHLGVVHLFTVEKPSVRPRETDLLESGFQPLAQIIPNLDAFETWSQICIRALFGETQTKEK
jgi:predicted NUDIX family phosphoesterase